MSDRPPVRSSDGAVNAPMASPVAQGLGPDALARRLVLLKTLGKGSAAVAVAAVPMHTLATTSSLLKTNPGKNNTPVCRCDVSGMMSAVGSRDIAAPVCSGYGWTKYKTLSFWPCYYPNTKSVKFFLGASQTACTEKSSFRSIFGSGGANTSLWNCINNGSVPECNWVAALLNALHSINTQGSLNFPYSPTEVVALYGSSRKADALKFFQTYMETKA